MDTLGPDIFILFLLQYSGSFSEVKNVLVTSVGTKIFCSYCGGFFYCILNYEGLLREVPLYVFVSGVSQSRSASIPQVLVHTYLYLILYYICL